MNRDTVKYGSTGAVGVLILYLALIAVQESQPYGSPLRDAVHDYVFGAVFPVLWIWDFLGVYGESGMSFLVPIFASIILYLSGIGFLFGLALSKIRQATK